MAVLEASDIVDLVRAGLKDLDRPNMVQIAQAYQDYPAFNQLMRQDRIIRGGHGLQWNIMVQHSGAASNVGMYHVDNVDIGDTQVQADIPWRANNTFYAFFLPEQAMNAGAHQIVNLLSIRRDDALISLAELWEQNFWTGPTSSSDKLKPFGLPYWLDYNATEGFNGGDHSGFSSGPGNVSSSTYSRWKNWTAQYTNVTKADLIRKIRKALTFTGFRAPMGAQTTPTDIATGQYGMYCPYTVIQQAEELAESQNDRLGPDIAAMDGRVTIRGVPLVWSPYLEGRAGNPVYGLNWSTLKTVVLPGFFLRESTNPAPNQHLGVHNHIDTYCNTRMKDRRRNFLIATADPGDS